MFLLLITMTSTVLLLCLCLLLALSFAPSTTDGKSSSRPLSVALCLALLVLTLTPRKGAKIIRKGAKDWSAVDWNKLEEAWGENDEDEEKVTESQVLEREMEKKKAEVNNMDMRKLKSLGPDAGKEYMQSQQASSGPTMMFIDLAANAGTSGINPAADRTWLEEDLNVIATQWKDLLKTGGFEASLYSIEGDRLLVSVAKGWHGKDVQNFFLSRSEVSKVTWNNVETVAKDYVEEF